MTNKADKHAEEIAQLKKEVEALKAKVSPPKSTFKEMSDAEHFDRIHQMRERQANSWMPPDVIREMVAAEPKGFMREVAMRDNRAPNNPGSMIPQQPSNARSTNVPGSGTGWAAERPLGPQPGINLIDRGVNAALPHGPEWGKEKR
jgi:hypothetical protein